MERCKMSETAAMGGIMGRLGLEVYIYWDDFI